MRFELVRERLRTVPRELPAPPAILMPVRIDAPEEWRQHGAQVRGREAAVLVLLFPDEDGEARVLLTARVPHLSAHAGEVSFPGGSAEWDDDDPIATAIREAQEEVGLDPVQCGAHVVGSLERPFIPVSGFRITPVVALAERRPVVSPAPDEVARIIDPPVEAFLPHAPVELEERVIREWLVRYGVYPVSGERVWGATARMLGQLGALLAAEPQAAAALTEPPARATDEPHAAATSQPQAAATDELVVARPAPLVDRRAPGSIDWTVRPALPADEPRIHAFLEALAPELAHALPASAATFVAELDGKPAGSGAASSGARTAANARPSSGAGPADDTEPAVTNPAVVGVASWAAWDRERDEDDPRGFDGVEFDTGERSAEITLLAVAPHLRGLGIGRRLTASIAEAARAAGSHCLLAWTLSDAAIHPSSIAARAFFRVAGFRDLAVDRRVRARGEDRLLLARDLSDLDG